jgi:Fur family ferric uptake transcriptional regulator
MEQQVEAWERHLRGHGYRITGQRELILRAVQDLPHPNQESILQHVQTDSPDLNRTTVYRTLAVLEEIGLIKHSHVGSGAPVYHLTEQEVHIHLVCQGCGEVVSVSGDLANEFVGSIDSLCGFRVDMSHTGLSGLCSQCRLGPH